MMLHVALIFLCLAMILHFLRHWAVLTHRMTEDRKDARIKAALDWKTQARDPMLGSTARGSAIRR